MASGPHFGSQNGHHFGLKIRLNSDLERSGGFRDRPKSGKKGIGRGSKKKPKNGPRDQRSARTAGHNLGPAECVWVVSPAECAEPGGDYRGGSGKDFGDSG